ncbi:MAG: hypothetical protein OEZ37_11575, partial [Gemmatimonadota bacterium]|nr:hypothetical protein [Gemmatimonadota bacterium]
MIVSLFPLILGAPTGGLAHPTSQAGAAKTAPVESPEFANLILSILGNGGAPIPAGNRGGVFGGSGTVPPPEGALAADVAADIEPDVEPDVAAPDLAVGGEFRTLPAGWTQSVLSTASLPEGARGPVDVSGIGGSDLRPGIRGLTRAAESRDIPVEGAADAASEVVTLPAGTVARADSASLEGETIEAEMVVGEVDGSEGARAAELASVERVDRDWDRLDPDLQVRLERVIDRMASEHGHRVELVEGARSAARQRYLYGQGRTRTGPVVTWTLDSLHKDGAAADLMVDGSWGNRKAYERLQKVAREEGLHTLGAMDPGHVELPSAEEALPVAEDRRVRVARVAEVADVATTARVSRVPRPGSMPSLAASGSPAPAVAEVTPRRSAPPVVSVRGPEDLHFAGSAVASTDGGSSPGTPLHAPPTLAGTSGRSDGSPNGSGRDRRSPSGEEAVQAADLADASSARRSTVEMRAAAAELLARAGDMGSLRADAVREVAGPDPLTRVDQIMEARELLKGIAPNRVAIRLDGTAGSAEQVRVDLT